MAKGEKEIAKSYVNLKKYIPLLLISVALGAFQTLLLKSFVISESVTNEHSFYFLTNVIMLSWGVIMLLAGTLKDRKNLREGLSFFKPKRIFSTASNVVCANVGTLLQVPILTMINVSVFSPLSSALGIVLSVVISLIFKEKLGIFSYIGAAVAVLAIFV
jgi:drug/metabolite transporter (DMT)-like permease